MPYAMDRIFRELDHCNLFVAIGTSGAVEPAASFVAQVGSRARTVYVGPEAPLNQSSFTECWAGKAGELLPELFKVETERG